MVARYAANISIIGLVNTSRTSTNGGLHSKAIALYFGLLLVDVFCVVVVVIVV